MCMRLIWGAEDVSGRRLSPLLSIARIYSLLARSCGRERPAPKRPALRRRMLFDSAAHRKLNVTPRPAPNLEPRQHRHRFEAQRCRRNAVG